MNCVQQSITEKWEPILRGDHENRGADDCPCCRQYLDNKHGHCGGCPISGYTGIAFCKRTPNVAFEFLKQICGFDADYYCYDIHAELTACAQWEIDFLHEVLNNGEG